MNLRRYKNTKKQGDAGLGIAIGWFCSEGITVCIPLTDSQDYDLVVDADGLKRVQVKTTTYKTSYGIYAINLSVKGGNRTGTGKIKRLNAKKVDALFIVCGNGKKYFIPISKTPARGQLNLGKTYQRFQVE